MSRVLPLIDYKVMTPTREFLQDVARVLGRAQQTFTVDEGHEWNKGLTITTEGLTTTKLPNTDTQIILNLQTHRVEAGNEKWALADHSAQEIMAGLQQWLKQRSIVKDLVTPEFTTTTATYNADHATALLAANGWVSGMFKTLKESLVKGQTSPVLIYPHHFDVSLVWFPKHDDTQLGFGFSFGDETIAEAYFYVTAYPQSQTFTNTALAAPAYWQTDGFVGAVLLYRDAAASPKPDQLFEDFVAQLISI